MINFTSVVAYLSEIGKALLFLAIAAVIGWIFLLAINRSIERITRRTKSHLDDAIMTALRLPVMLIILLISFRFAVDSLTFLPEAWDNPLSNGFFILALLIIYLLIYRLIRNLSTWYVTDIATHTDTPLDDQILPFIRRTALIILTITAIIVLLSHLDINVSAFITTLGIGSLAIALAAQATLSDTISGFVIMVDRPFRIGDRIELLDLDTWGDVVDIGLRSTRILTRDNRMVVVPNAVIGKSLVVNHSYPDTHYRVQTEIGVAYGTDIETARQVMIEAVRKQDWVMKDERIEALFLRFGDSAMIFRVRCWIEHYVETRRIIDKLNTCLFETLVKEGIEIPFPHQVVYLENNQSKQNQSIH
jgi:small-conductance mechanosensitive channel